MTTRSAIRLAILMTAVLVAVIGGSVLGGISGGGPDADDPQGPGADDSPGDAPRAAGTRDRSRATADEQSQPDATQGLQPDATQGLPSDATQGLQPDATQGLPSDATQGLPSDATPGSQEGRAFWGLIDQTRAAAGDNTEQQSELLEERLRKLPAEAIAAFERVRHSLDERLYSWDVWGAAYVIEDGCSDDCFRDFRAYLISLGLKAVEDAVRDPDSLASVVKDAEEGDWENADDVAPDAYDEVAGEDIPVGGSDLSGEPSGQQWDDDQEEALIARYPALAERFR